MASTAILEKATSAQKAIEKAVTAAYKKMSKRMWTRVYYACVKAGEIELAEKCHRRAFRKKDPTKQTEPNKRDCSVRQLNALVKERGVELDGDDLTFKDEVLGDDERGLSSYGVADGSLLSMGSAQQQDDDQKGDLMQIFVRYPDNKLVSLSGIGTDDTIQSIREKAEIRDDQCVYFNASRLQDGDTVAQHEIGDGSVIHVQAAAAPIVFVRRSDRDIVPLSVEIDEKVKAVKTRLCENMGGDTDGVKLRFQGNLLSDERMQSQLLCHQGQGRAGCGHHDIRATAQRRCDAAGRAAE